MRQATCADAGRASRLRPRSSTVGRVPASFAADQPLIDSTNGCLVDITSFPLLSPLLSLAYDGLMVVTALVTPIAGAAAPAVAVALVTLLVRTALLPLGVATARAEQARARLAPRLRDLQRR